MRKFYDITEKWHLCRFSFFVKILLRYSNRLLTKHRGGKDNTTRYADCFYFDSTEKAANGCLALVLSGKKRATASSLLYFEYKGEPIPKVGDYSIITDWDGTPHCVIETTSITIIPYGDMTYDIAKREGEDDTLEEWQITHERFFREQGEALGYKFSESMLVVFEDFEVVYTK